MGKWKRSVDLLVIIIIMYIDHALISALSTQMIHINLNTISYTHVEHSPTNTIYAKYYMETPTRTHARTHAPTHTHGLNQSAHGTWHLFPKTNSAADDICVQTHSHLPQDFQTSIFNKENEKSSEKLL